MTVACSSKETGKSTRKICKVGCIGCGLCAKQTDIFIVEENLARLDYVKYQPSEQTDTAMNKCPTKVIVFRGKNDRMGKQAAEEVEARYSLAAMLDAHRSLYTDLLARKRAEV